LDEGVVALTLTLYLFNITVDIDATDFHFITLIGRNIVRVTAKKDQASRSFLIFKKLSKV
jgi:hypothetical protein